MCWFSGTSSIRLPSRPSAQTVWSQVWRKVWVACVRERGGRWSFHRTGDTVKTEVSHCHHLVHTLNTISFSVMFNRLCVGVSSWRSPRECSALLWAGVSGAAEGCAWRLHVCLAGRQPQPPLSCYGPQRWQWSSSRGGKQTSRGRFY